MHSSPFDGWPKRDGVLEEFHPRNASSATYAVSSVGLAAWTWSAWVAWPATIAAAFVPHQAHLLVQLVSLSGLLQLFAIEYEIGVDPLGGAAYATYWRGYPLHCTTLGVADETIIISTGVSHPVGPLVIPAGSTIAHRVRTSQPAATIGYATIGAYLAGYDGGDAPVSYRPYGLRPHLAGVHRAQTRNAPTGAHVNAVSAVWPAFGAWSASFLTAAKDLLVWGVARYGPVSGLAWPAYVEIGSGPVGGTTVPRSRIALPALTTANASCQWHRRPTLIKAGEELRVRVAGTAVGVTFPLAVMWEEA